MAFVIESVLGGVTLVVLGSLWLVDRVDRRRIKEDEDALMADPIRPFEAIRVGTLCHLCGEAGANVGGVWSRGPGFPRACTDKHKCKLKCAHLHVSCKTCGSEWAMKTLAESLQA